MDLLLIVSLMIGLIAINFALFVGYIVSRSTNEDYEEEIINYKKKIATNNKRLRKVVATSNDRYNALQEAYELLEQSKASCKLLACQAFELQQQAAELKLQHQCDVELIEKLKNTPSKCPEEKYYNRRSGIERLTQTEHTIHPQLKSAIDNAASARHEVDLLKMELLKAKATSNSLSFKIHCLESEKAHMQAKIDDVQPSLEQLQQTNDKIRHQEDVHLQYRTQAEKKIWKLEMDVGNLHEEARRSKEELVNATKSEAEKNKIIRELKKEQEKNKLDVKSSTQTISDDLNGTIAQMQACLDERESEAFATKAQIEQQQKEIKDLKAKLAAQTNEGDKIQEERIKLKRLLKVAEQENRMLRASVSQAKRESRQKGRDLSVIVQRKVWSYRTAHQPVDIGTELQNRRLSGEVAALKQTILLMSPSPSPPSSPVEISPEVSPSASPIASPVGSPAPLSFSFPSLLPISSPAPSNSLTVDDIDKELENLTIECYAMDDESTTQNIASSSPVFSPAPAVLNMADTDDMDSQQAQPLQIPPQPANSGSSVVWSQQIGVHIPAVLQVRHGNITQEVVSAIVNAANSNLNHGDGVAGAIVQAGGPTIQAESTRLVNQHGPIPPGSIAVTGPGSLNCGCIIHAVGPRNEAGLLYNAVWCSLQEANQRGLSSISFPAISSGIFGLPKELCAKVMVEAVANFCTQTIQINLREVRLVNIDFFTVKCFEEQVKAKFGNAPQP